MKVKDKKKVLKTYKTARATYETNLERLKEMENILRTIDSQSETLDKIISAQGQCNICLRRYDNIIESIEKNDYRYFESQ